MASHLTAPCMLVTEFGMLVPVAVLAFRSLALARGVERRLSAEGAVCVFTDFSDADIFLRSVYEITNAA